MTTYITIATMSGGEGKTRTAVDISHRLATLGKKTMLVGFDSQGNDSTYLGMDPEPCVFNFLLADLPTANSMRATTRPKLWLLPGNSKNKIIDRSDLMRDDIAATFRRQFDTVFDYVVFDTPPSGLLQESALTIADAVVIPSKTETKGMEAITKTIAAVERLQDSVRPSICILATIYDQRIGEHKTNLALLKGEFPDHFVGAIPYRAKLIECASYGKTIWEHDPANDACTVYDNLIRRIADDTITADFLRWVRK